MATGAQRKQSLMGNLWAIQNKASLETLWENRADLNETHLRFVRDLRSRFVNEDNTMSVTEFKRLLNLTKSLSKPVPTTFVLMAEFSRTIANHSEIAEALKKIPSYWYPQELELNFLNSFQTLNLSEKGIILGVSRVCFANEKSNLNLFMQDLVSTKGANLMTPTNGIYQTYFVGGGAVDDLIGSLTSRSGDDECDQEMMTLMAKC